MQRKGQSAKRPATKVRAVLACTVPTLSHAVRRPYDVSPLHIPCCQGGALPCVPRAALMYAGTTQEPDAMQAGPMVQPAHAQAATNTAAGPSHHAPAAAATHEPVNQLRATTDAMQDLLTSQDHTIQTLRQGKAQLQARAAQDAERITNLTAIIATKDQAIQELTHTSTQLTQKLEATTGKDKTIQELREQVASLQGEKESLQGELAQLQAFKERAKGIASFFTDLNMA